MSNEYQKFVQMSSDTRFEVGLVRVIKGEGVSYDRRYVYHTAWAARILAKTRPEKHVDISSSLYFNTLVSAFVPIDSYDFRPLSIPLSGLQIGFANLSELSFEDNSIPSLSCMHVVEHIGLGRYGDPIDPGGDLGAISELKRVLAGDLLFVVPISGWPRVLFNLHRIYSYDQIVECFSELKLMEFALIPDKGALINNASREMANEQDYGCGCFWFRKD